MTTEPQYIGMFTGTKLDCPYCPEEEDGYEGFSWSWCDNCQSELGGDRYAAHGVSADGLAHHYSVCVDCLFRINGLPVESES